MRPSDDAARTQSIASSARTDAGEAAGPLGPHLSWVAKILWRHLPGIHVSMDGNLPPGYRMVEEFAVLPSASRPRLLVPTGSTAAASACLRQFNDSMSQRARVSKALVGTGLRGGIVQRFASRLTVGVAVNGNRRREAALLENHLREVFDRPDLELAITLGTIRPNRKPVLQALTSAGEVVGYVKVGWNDVTRRLVSNEARVLEAWRRRTPRHLQAPRLLHHGEWNGLTITAVSAAPHRVWRRGPRNAPPPISVLQEVASLGGIQRGAFGASPYWRDLRGRIDRGQLPDSIGDRVDPVLSRLEDEHGGRALSFGTWHGDWAPWNMSRVGGTLFIWDWERSADLVPIGLDAVHFFFQVHYQFGGRNVDASAVAALRRAAGQLRALGAADGTDRLLLSLYLLELLLRFEEGRASQVMTQPDVSAAIVETLCGQAGSP